MYAMKKDRRLSRLFALSILSLLAALTPLAPAYAAQVAVTVENLTEEDGGFIVEPLLVTLSGNQTAEDVIKKLLDSRYITYKFIGKGEGFYLTLIQDPSTGAYLGATTENPSGGWMVTVNNVYIGTSAGAHTLSDGDVMRWQYTKNLGSDIGGNPDNLGKESHKLNKDDLIRKVAEINAAGNQSDYGGAYTNALSVLKDLGADTSDIGSALTALAAPEEKAATPDTGENSGGGGGGCNAGAAGLIALAVLRAVMIARGRRSRH
jgi:hypothetical protein